jgi:hypothetical protein
VTSAANAERSRARSGARVDVLDAGKLDLRGSYG